MFRKGRRDRDGVANVPGCVRQKKSRRRIRFQIGCCLLINFYSCIILQYHNSFSDKQLSALLRVLQGPVGKLLRSGAELPANIKP